MDETTNRMRRAVMSTAWSSVNKNKEDTMKAFRESDTRFETYYQTTSRKAGGSKNYHFIGYYPLSLTTDNQLITITRVAGTTVYFEETSLHTGKTIKGKIVFRTVAERLANVIY